jgi:hypothetical protein
MAFKGVLVNTALTLAHGSTNFQAIALTEMLPNF